MEAAATAEVDAGVEDGEDLEGVGEGEGRPTVTAVSTACKPKGKPRPPTQKANMAHKVWRELRPRETKEAGRRSGENK